MLTRVDVQAPTVYQFQVIEILQLSPMSIPDIAVDVGAAEEVIDMPDIVELGPISMLAEWI